MKKLIPFLFLTAIMFSNCMKNNDINCDNAELCITNIGSDTINYSWGSTLYTDYMLPGNKACINVGHIEVTKNSSATEEVYFYSDHGNFIIVVDECLEEHDIE